jgi:hypothetical protein
MAEAERILEESIIDSIRNNPMTPYTVICGWHQVSISYLLEVAKKRGLATRTRGPKPKTPVVK